MTSTRFLLRAAPAALLASSFAAALPAQAQEYPSKTITFIVPYAAGGSADQRSRQLIQKLGPLLGGKSIIADNKPGAGGNIGTEAVARAVPDGHTIGMGNFAPLSVNQTLFKKLNFDPQKDVLPVVLIERGPLTLMVNAKSPYKTVKDVVAAAKAKPGVMTAANGGIGGSHHLSAELFKQAAGIDMISVAYKGGAPAATDLMAGTVDIMFEQMYAAMPSLQGGKARALAVTGRTRVATLPDVPTFIESGYPDVVVLNWQGIIVPKGTPQAIIDKLNTVFNQVLKDPDMREKITSQGNEVGGGTPKDFADLIASESVKWGKVVRAAKIQPE
jgi:tripartite-type tricarboxylate transporter receptor subunit TctC